MLLEKARGELRTLSSSGEGRKSLKETLMGQIKEQENLKNKLHDEKNMLLSTKEMRSQQQGMWSDVIRLLQMKIKCFKESENKGAGGTLMVEKNAETFTLQ